MKQQQSNRILIWLVVILAATNLSTIGSFFYHQIAEVKSESVKQTDETVIPGEQRTRFFKEELNLSTDQLDAFRNINRTFNRTARGIESELDELRKGLIDELGRSTSDTVWLDSIAARIGENHRELKKVTTTFYLDMKKICTPEQQTRLHEIFQSMLNKDNQVNLPKPGYQRGRGPNR